MHPKYFKRSSLYNYYAQFHGLLNVNKGQESSAPYLLRHKGYLLLSRLLMPHKKKDHNIF
jgi:hypothetical protein